MTAQRASPSPLSMSQTPFFGVEGLKSLSGDPLKIYVAAWHEMLGFAARRMQDQADYMKTLAECSDPADAWKCHAQFMQNCWSRSLNEGGQMFDTLKSGRFAASAHK